MGQCSDQGTYRTICYGIGTEFKPPKDNYGWKIYHMEYIIDSVFTNGLHGSKHEYTYKVAVTWRKS